MVDLREVWAWFVFYVLATIAALVLSFFLMHLIVSSIKKEERSSGPMEQQFYLLLVDRGYWVTGNPRDSEFGNGMTRAGRERYSTLLNGIRFKSDCRFGEDEQIETGMTCKVNGEDIYFVYFGGW